MNVSEGHEGPSERVFWLETSENASLKVSRVDAMGSVPFRTGFGNAKVGLVGKIDDEMMLL